MKKLIVYITICCLLFTSCATISNVKPNQNSTKLFSIIEENAKDQKITVELVNGKFYHTTNLYFKNEFLTFVEIDSSKIENVKLDEIHRIVIEKKDISSGKTFRNWIFAGITFGSFLTLSTKLGSTGGSSDDLKPPNSFYFLLFSSILALSAVCGFIHIAYKQSRNNKIYFFNPKVLK